LILKDVREEKEYQVSHLSKAQYVSPSLKDMEQVMKMIAETGIHKSFQFKIYQ